MKCSELVGKVYLRTDKPGLRTMEKRGDRFVENYCNEEGALKFGAGITGTGIQYFIDEDIPASIIKEGN